MAVLCDHDAQNFQRSKRKQHEIYQGVLQILGQYQTPFFYDLYYWIELGNVLQLKKITSHHSFNFQKKKCKLKLTWLWYHKPGIE